MPANTLTAAAATGLRPADLLPGDVGFSSIRGALGAGVLAGQTAIDLAALLRGRPGAVTGWITHAWMVTAVHPDAGQVDLVEAMPSGARQIRAGVERLTAGHAYTRLPLTEAERARVAAAALGMVGTPYGFGQYAAIAALTLAGGETANPGGPLARWVQRRDPATGLPRRAICSQLVDEAYRQAGIPLFTDGRPAAYVTPGALWWRTAQLGDIWVC
jgi:cell wall-associated NlpC family hydrolase